MQKKAKRAPRPRAHRDTSRWASTVLDVSKSASSCSSKLELLLLLLLDLKSVYLFKIHVIDFIKEHFLFFSGLRVCLTDNHEDYCITLIEMSLECYIYLKGIYTLLEILKCHLSEYGVFTINTHFQAISSRLISSYVLRLNNYSYSK